MRYIFWLIIILLIFVRFITTRPSFIDGQKIRITEKVLQEPTRYDNFQVTKLLGLKISLPAFPEIIYGDEIIVEGVVDDDKLFDAKLISVKRQNTGLFVVRKKLLEFYKNAFPSPHSSLVAGVVIGSKEGISGNFWESLKNSGTLHVVVASGMNVTLVAGFLMTLFLSVLSRKMAVTTSIIGIWSYALISGLDAPIVRAAIMGSLAFGAQALGRINLASRALITSIVVMLLIKPDWLLDLGFILSVVATASLMLFEAKINRKILFVPSIFREGLSTSLAAQIGVAPILFIVFKQFNIISPLVNAITLWTIPPITVIGAIAGVIGLVFFDLGKLILYLIYPLTSWFIFMVNLFG